MFSPIFVWEIRRVIHRPWFRNVRITYGAILLVLFFWHCASVQQFFAEAKVEFQYAARLITGHSETMRWAFMAAHFYAMFLIAPILGIGSIMQEKKRRTLDLLLTTQQRPWQIVLGKWLAALAELALVLLPNLPFLLWMQGFLVDRWWTMVLWFACSLAAAAPLTAWPVLAATLMRHQTGAVFLGYAGNAALVVCMPLVFTDAQLALWPHAIYGPKFWLAFLACTFLPTIVFLALAGARLRPESEQSPRSTWLSHWSRPHVDDKPIYWKQRFASYQLLPWFLRLAPGWLRVAAFGIICMGVGIPLREDWLFYGYLGVLCSFPLAALVLAGHTICGERETGTWDSLRLAPLSATEFVQQTIRGIQTRIVPYWLAFLPAIVVLAVKHIPHGFTIFVLWCMVGAEIHYCTIGGLYASQRGQSAWPSILRALSLFSFRVIVLGTACFAAAIMIAAAMGCLCLTGLRDDNVMFAVGMLTLFATAIFFGSLPRRIMVVCDAPICATDRRTRQQGWLRTHALGDGRLSQLSTKFGIAGLICLWHQTRLDRDAHVLRARGPCGAVSPFERDHDMQLFGQE